MPVYHKMKMFSWIVILVVSGFSCTNDGIADRSEGFITVPGGKVWYEIVGAEKPGTPLLLLHGGPGFTSDYLRPLEILADERPVIFYDQLGSGKSDRPKDTSLWKITRFVEELSILRTELKLDEIHLFGHSWGTMLATQYLTKNPTGIRSLILASPCISTEKWLNDANELRRQLPQPVQDSLKFHEDRGTITAEGYIAATEEFYSRHLCRVPYTKEIQTTLKEQGVEVYNTMWGTNEFTSTGNLRTFDRTDILKTIDIPSLFTCGQFDEATPETTRWYADQVRNSEFQVVDSASHMTMNERPEAYAAILRSFLKKHEQQN